MSPKSKSETLSATKEKEERLSTFYKQEKSKVGFCRCRQSKGLDKGIRTSMENFGAFGDVLIYPLYAIGNITDGRS